MNGALLEDGTQSTRQIPINFVNEAGLYLAIGNSRKPEAKEFMAWIFSEVLPTLNKKGYYIMGDKPIGEVISELITETENNTEEIAFLKNALSEVTGAHNRFVLMYKKKYDSISGYAHSNNFALSLDMAKDIATRAARLAKEMNMEIGTIPHKKWGQVRSYPNAVLDIVFQDYFSEMLNDYDYITSTNKEELEQY